MRFPPVSWITCQISCLMALTEKNRKEKSFYPPLCWLWLNQGWSTKHCHFSCLRQAKSLALLCACTKASGELQTQSYPLASHDELRKEKKSDFRFRLPLSPATFQSFSKKRSWDLAELSIKWENKRGIFNMQGHKCLLSITLSHQVTGWCGRRSR